MLSEELQNALGMTDGAPPPWLVNMQRYGPPPSYPSLKIPGLNAPIPPGAQFGYHAGAATRAGQGRASWVMAVGQLDMPPPTWPQLAPLLLAYMCRCWGLTAASARHAGGWGKPPVDEFGRPIYGNVCGVDEEEVDEDELVSRVASRVPAGCQQGGAARAAPTPPAVLAGA